MRSVEIVVGCGQTVPVEIFLLTCKTAYTNLSLTLLTPEFDRKLCPFCGVFPLLLDVKGCLGMQLLKGLLSTFATQFSRTSPRSKHLKWFGLAAPTGLVRWWVRCIRGKAAARFQKYAFESSVS